MRRARLAAGLAAASLVIVAGGEFFARYGLGLGDPPLTIRDPEIDYLFKPGTYQRFGNTITYNSFSMRADEVVPSKTDLHELRVLVFGDSVINGGALTDDSDLATRLAQEMLAERLQRPVWVGNVSAGSWGPGNMLAYADRYGWFDADIAIVVLSSHDLGDVPDFQADLGVNFPLQAPVSALSEAVTRYLPRYLPGWSFGVSADEPRPAAQPEVDRETNEKAGRQLLHQLLQTAERNVATIAVLHHPKRDERDGEPTGRTMQWRRAADLLEQTAAEAGISMLQLAPYLDRATEDPYRDTIHINAAGQRAYADALVCVAEQAQGLNGETCA